MQNVEYKKLEKTAVKAWRLLRLLGLFAFTAILIAFIILTALSGKDEFFLVMSVLSGLLVLYKLVGFFVYPLIEYRQWKYFISEERIEIVHGIFFIKRDIIPIVRIQNITAKQGPIYRRYDLYTVEIALASGTFNIVGLSRGTADEIATSIRDRLYGEQVIKGDE